MELNSEVARSSKLRPKFGKLSACSVMQMMLLYLSAKALLNRRKTYFTWWVSRWMIAGGINLALRKHRSSQLDQNNVLRPWAMAKYLGLKLDSRMNFSEQIKTLCGCCCLLRITFRFFLSSPKYYVKRSQASTLMKGRRLVGSPMAGV